MDSNDQPDAAETFLARPAAQIEALGGRSAKLFRDYLRKTPLSVETIEGGIVPGMTPASPGLFYAGVYRPSGECSPTSLVMRRETPHRTREASEILQMNPEQCAGEAMYAGQLIPHFGHFLLEGTSRLWWALKNNFEGAIVFEARRPGATEVPFVRRFLELTGLLDRTIVVKRPLQFTRVFVPQPSFRLTTEIHREMLRAFAIAYRALDASESETDGRPVYLSRTDIQNGAIVGEHLVEQALEQQGFCILHPERLSLDRQIAVVAAAPIVAGIQGSALHTMLFAPEPKRAVYLRREDRPTANYVMIDQLLGNRSAYLLDVMNAVPEGVEGAPQLLDVEKAFDMLQTLGLLHAGKRPTVDRNALQERYRRACAAHSNRITSPVR